MICKGPDEFLDPEQAVVWIATVTDGIDTSEVWQDDGRPGLERSAWIRLQQYVKEHNLRVIGLRLQFRSHVEPLPSNADGYYFSNIFVGGMGGSMEGYRVGYLHNNKWHLLTFQKPELVQKEYDVVDKNDVKLEFVILNEKEAHV